ncbi:MAG: AAA family ATPase [Anaerocolumna sp.]
MLFYRVEIELSTAIADVSDKTKKMHPLELSNYLDPYNTLLLDLYEENDIHFMLQFLTMDTPSELLAYVAYDQKIIDRGYIDVEKDVLEICKVINLPSCLKTVVYEEVSAFDYNRAITRYGINSRLRDILTKQFGLDYVRYETSGYQVTDRIVDGYSITNKTSAKKAMKKLLPDAAMVKEIDRIFNTEHPKDLYYGIPVHYKLSAKSDLVADDMVDLIVNCLYTNKRLLSRRITKIDNIEDKRWDKENFSKLIKCSQGTAIEIMLNGDVATEQEYASQYHRVSDLLAEYIKVNSGSILFFLVENMSHPGFAKQLIGKIDEELDILEINEGVGNSRQALSYFMALLDESNMQKFYDNDVIFEKDKFYSATEVRTRFNQWRKARLKDRVYSAYNQNLALRVDKDISKKGSAFDELQTLVGLEDVKSIVKDIISAYKVQKMRNKYYDSNEAFTRHMIFTGNPGTAKTTVARLMTEIMKENGILKTGTFIEVGRADLVGKYVGWTATIVKDKFSQAQGGVLFIDEAYSLVDDSHSFGDEAINTIVQEMENKRGDVIVIFAGYPEKMNEFLAKNEGLRSRIAFHVKFPDYNPIELMGILDKILKGKQYRITAEAREKTLQIFYKVYKQEGYGNGRFVRNLFEQAVNRQATRITTMERKEISREELFELCASDFDTNIVEQYKNPQNHKIGFAF